MTVLDWIDMNIGDMPRIVFIIADQMLPIAALPNTALTFFLPTIGALFHEGKIARKARFEQSPTRCKSSVIRWQRPYRMQVVGQDDDGVDMKRMALLNQPYCIAQDIDRIHQQGV